MLKDIYSGDEARRGLLKGIENVCNVVKTTHGPKGKNVLFEGSSGTLEITRDGVTIARHMNTGSPLELAGARLLKQACYRTNELAGDGTTTSCILAGSLVKEGMSHVLTGTDPILLKAGIDKAVKIALEELPAFIKPVQTKEDVKAVATISAANDPEIGEMIANALDKIGLDGVITLKKSNAFDTTVEVMEGMQLDNGMVVPHFATEVTNGRITGKTTLEDPVLLLTDRELNNVHEIIPILEGVAKSTRPILLIAKDYSQEVLLTLLGNAEKGIIKVCPIKLPSFGPHQKPRLKDIAAMTGGTIVDDEAGMDFTNFTEDMFGQAKEVIVSHNRTTIVAHDRFKESIDQRIKELEYELSIEERDYRKEKIQEQIGKLSGGVATIFVAAPTEHEQQDKYYRIEDAVMATRSAVDEGIVPGGGTIQIRLTEIIQLNLFKFKTRAEVIGAEIVIKALGEIFRTVCENASINPDVALLDLESSDNPDTGLNIVTGNVGDMFEAGVVDPAKVTRASLINAASVAGEVLLTDNVILEQFEDGKPKHIKNEYE